MTCLDVGASTGGFTETLLNRGAKKVIAIDVGTNQIIAALKNNPAVLSLEETDIRTIKPLQDVDLIVVDVSFISLTNIIPSLLEWNAPQIIVLIKPQFEVPRSVAAKSHGIIKSKDDHDYAIENVTTAFTDAGFTKQGLIESPIKGGSGNTEYLALFKRN